MYQFYLPIKSQGYMRPCIAYSEFYNEVLFGLLAYSFTAWHCKLQKKRSAGIC